MDSALNSINIARSFQSFSTPIIADFHETPSFENFLIFGVPPDIEGTPHVDILTLYPYYPLALYPCDMERVIDYVFPTGPIKTKIAPREKGSVIDEFTFGLRGVDQMLYGACVHFRIPENVNEITYVSPKNHNFVFAMVLLTHQPIFTTHFRFLTYLVKTTVRMERIKSDIEMPEGMKPFDVKAPSDYEIVMPKNMRKSGPTLCYKKVKVTKSFLRDLSYYKGLKRRDESYDYFQSDSTKFVIPAIPRVVPNTVTVGCATFDCLFSHLSVKNIIRLYRSILLENRVVIISHVASRASNCVLAFRSIMAPFKIQASFNPIFPSLPEYQELLQCPTPFVYGMVETSEMKVDSIEEPYCIAYIDKDILVMKSSNAKIPEENEIIERIENVLKNHEDDILVPDLVEKPAVKGALALKKEISKEWKKFFQKCDPMSMPPHFVSQLRQKYVFTQEVVEEILNVFRNAKFIKEIEDYEEGCRVTETTKPDNPIIVLNKDMFLTLIPEKHKRFYSYLMETSLFDAFIQRRIDKTKQKKMTEENPTKENIDNLRKFEDEELLFEYT